MESVHNKLNRVRKPRVHIKYDIETEDATVSKELPFVVGVMGEFSGSPTRPSKPFSERKFVRIDRDNFNDVMSNIHPGLELRVKNTLRDDSSDMSVELEFTKMEDFEPGAVVQQVPALKSLLDARNALRDLLTKADRSEKLELLLEEILQNDESLKGIADELGIGANQSNR